MDFSVSITERNLCQDVLRNLVTVYNVLCVCPSVVVRRVQMQRPSLDFLCVFPLTK